MSQEPETTTEAVHAEHPTQGTYFKVAITLVVLTALEVGVFYLEFLSYGIIPVLVLLSGAKFILVAMFYMHLKFDNRIFSTLFVAGLVLAAAVVSALMGLFRAFG